MGFVQCPAQPACKPEHNSNQTLVRRPLGNIHLFNAERDVRQMMVFLLIMSYSHLHMTPVFNVSLLFLNCKATFCKLLVPEVANTISIISVGQRRSVYPAIREEDDDLQPP